MGWSCNADAAHTMEAWVAALDLFREVKAELASAALGQNPSTAAESLAVLEEWMSRDDVLGKTWPWPAYEVSRCDGSEWVKRGNVAIPSAASLPRPHSIMMSIHRLNRSGP